MNNDDFLKYISIAFKKFLQTGSRSNEKLKILHGAIAKDISQRLGSDYEVKSLGFKNGKEFKIKGRYYDKNVDITILKDKKVLAGISVKFVMQNYSQNSINYFENMMGETANIRSKSIPYFQIFIIPEKLPYYKKGGEIKCWEFFSEHNANKYLALSKDNIDLFYHSPLKTLLFLIRLPEVKKEVTNRQEYANMYLNYENISVSISDKKIGKFQHAVIHNEYQDFITKIYHYIKSI